MRNRLERESSPYLQQHKDNPIDWFPWGDEAFERASREEKPVFLSVGYASCHWCHVMAHESFEDQEVAEILNREFVNVKVDREERPDVDEAYMTAVHLQSGRGGWPMTVFMTPDRRPFFAGTYYPKHDRPGAPGLITIAKAVADQWRERRTELEDAAEDFAAALRETLGRSAPSASLTIGPESFLWVVSQLAADFDKSNGGFGGAPKFPPHTAIRFLQSYAAWPEADAEGASAAREMARTTLQAICLGGIRDHVGGGFHRYSTDATWLLPHFEKTLYDNALLLECLANLDSEGADARERLTVEAREGTLRWLRDEMASAEGLYYSAIDADSEGEEGRFYVWTAAEVREALGEAAGAFGTTYRIEADGNFHDEATRRKTGANIPHLRTAPPRSFEPELAVLRRERATRVRPSRDTKCLVGWNGLAIAGLARAGQLEHAARAASALLEAEGRFGRLPHLVFEGAPSGEAFLEDYAFLAMGLLHLANSMQEQRFRTEASRLVRTMVDAFWDSDIGGFFSTSDRHESLFGRTKPAFDQPTPSANSAAIRALVRVGDLERAQSALSAMLGWMERAPTATEGLWLAALELYQATETATQVAASRAPLPIPPFRVEVGLEESELAIGEDGWARGAVTINIPEGMHINAHEPELRWLIGTSLSVPDFDFAVDYPKGGPVGYVGDVRIPFRVKLPGADAEVEFRVDVRFQACTERECLEPQDVVLIGSARRAGS